MADITWTDVVGLDAALASVPVVAQNIYLGLANRLSPCLGELLDEARILYAAHFGTLNLRAAALGANAAGPVTSEREGELSAGYANGFASGVVSTSGLAATLWGTMYLAIIRASGARGPHLT